MRPLAPRLERGCPGWRAPLRRPPGPVAPGTRARRLREHWKDARGRHAARLGAPAERAGHFASRWPAWTVLGAHAQSVTRAVAWIFRWAASPMVPVATDPAGLGGGARG